LDLQLYFFVFKFDAKRGSHSTVLTEKECQLIGQVFMFPRGEKKCRYSPGDQNHWREKASQDRKNPVKTDSL